MNRLRLRLNTKIVLVRSKDDSDLSKVLDQLRAMTGRKEFDIKNYHWDTIPDLNTPGDSELPRFYLNTPAGCADFKIELLADLVATLP